MEEAADELRSRDRTALNLSSGGVFIGESEVAVLELAQPVVAEGDAKDVRSEIFASLLT